MNSRALQNSNQGRTESQTAIHRNSRIRTPKHYYSVHCISMKNITLSADEDLIEQARLVARAQRKTLNAAFREWLAQFAGLAGNAKEAELLMKRLSHVKAGRRFSRDEMNER